MILQSKSGWKWYGFAGHFICASRCQYHLCTNIHNKYLISTVGKFVPDPLRKPEVMDTVGSSNQYYETYVFRIDGEDEYGNPKMLDGSCLEIDSCRYETSIEAEKGHYMYCEKWDEILYSSGVIGSQELFGE